MSRRYQEEASVDSGEALPVATETPVETAAPVEAPKQERMALPDMSLVGATAEELAKRSVQKQLRGGFCYLMHPTFEEFSVAKSGSIMVQLTMAPCTPDYKAKRPLLTHCLVFPFVNPSVPGHAAPDTWRMCADYLAAEDQNFANVPKFVKGSKPAQYKCSDGRLINALENRVEKLKVETAINDRLKERGVQYQKTGRSDFCKKTAFIYAVVETEIQAAGEYAGKASQRITKVSATPIEGYQLLTNADEFGEEVVK